MAKQTFLTGDVLTAAAMTSLQQTAMGGGSTTAKTVSYTLVAADAGTVVQMNSASATTITVNTALFAAGDTVQIQNIGAGVCTVTAGTATVNTIGSLALSQYAGGELYFNTTSAAFFYGVDAAAAASGGMTLLSTTTLSGTSTSIGVSATGFKNLVAYIYGINIASGNFNANVRINSITAATYTNFNSSCVPAGTITNTGGDTSAIDLNQPGNVSIASGALNAWNLTFWDCNSTQKKNVTVIGSYINMNAVNNIMENRVSVTAATSAITNITVISGSSISAGTIEIYGVK